MPPLFSFLLKHIATGVAVGWAFVGALLGLDVGGFGSLVLGSSSKFVALALLAVFFAITFGSAAVATAVLMGNDFAEDGEDGTDMGSLEVLDLMPELATQKAPGLRPHR